LCICVKVIHLRRHLEDQEYLQVALEPSTLLNVFAHYKSHVVSKYRYE
jgi:hypothetical protein